MNILLGRAVAISIVVLAGTIPAARAESEDEARAALTRSQVQTTEKPKKPVEDLPNFHEVHPYLWRGGEPTLKGLDELKEKGVTTIIDLRAYTPQAKLEDKTAKKLGMKYINLPMDAHAPTEKQVKTFIKTVEKAKNKPQDETSPDRVFVHCQHGSDRTGCMVGIWRVTHDGYSYADAYSEMRKYYFGPKFTQLSGAVKSRAKS